MKKLVAILLVSVLACSFLFGALATAGNMPNSGKCFLNTKYPGVCNTTTCKLYVTYTCPNGNNYLVWDGDYCCEP